MTALNKPIKRSTNAVIRDKGRTRRLVVTLYPGDVIGLRPEKTRREEITSLAAVYSLAIKQRLAAERAEKIKARKARQS